MKMRCETCYVSCNCSQTPSSAHWGKNNYICYASCNSVRICDPHCGSGGQVIYTLTGHKSRVNSVRWLGGVDFEDELVSGSSDHNAIVWSFKSGKYVSQLLSGHESNVNIVDGIYRGKCKKNAVVVTISMDCTARIWTRDLPEDAFSHRQTLNFGYSISVGLRISFLPQVETVFLACALDNSQIQLYLQNESQQQFDLATSLKGHEDWVRSLDFTVDDKGDIILASSSQDMYIRLWRITPRNLDNIKSSDSIFENNIIKIKNREYRIYVDSILTGHEGWVYSVNWSPKRPQLLSASLDKSMIIWELDPDSNLWLEKIRVGEVGGNTLGFYGGLFGPDGDTILAHSYHGAFHIWSNHEGEWQPNVTIGGHFGEVTDLAWEPQGEFLMSVSADQTTRIHAPWVKNSMRATWHEIARPQVHGYDLSSIAIFSRYKFASSAEEKVIRTFQAPQNFVENFNRICNVDEKCEGYLTNDQESGPKGASVPSLGLSNKAVFTDDNLEGSVEKSKDYPEESHFTAVTLTEPPTEETLLQNTLWPEIQKLYGHGYEVYSLASSPDGKLLASACKATTPEHAAVLLWDTENWKVVQKLLSHTLTVVQISFSPDSQSILTVSRDRRWSLFSKNNLNQFELVATTDKKTSIHTRIIWCCSWSHDSKYFITGSRDGKICAWTRNSNGESNGILGQYESASNYLEIKSESVTAVAFAPDMISDSYLVAIGLESGVIHLYSWTRERWSLFLTLDQSAAHHLTVKRLSFRPQFGKAGSKNCDRNILQLASCSSDYSVRIYNIMINDKD